MNKEKDYEPLFGVSDFPQLNIGYDHKYIDPDLKASPLSKFEIDPAFITKIKKQLVGNCVMYASTAMLETYALLNQFVSSKTDLGAILSETYMSYSMFDVQPNKPLYKNPEGLQTPLVNETPDYRAGLTNASAYFARKSVEAIAITDPEINNLKTTKKFPERLTDITLGKWCGYGISRIKFLENPVGPQPDRIFISDVKSCLVTFGAVYSEFFYSPDRSNQAKSGTGYTLACCSEYPVPKNQNSGYHAVTIIGWDDNFPVDAFSANRKPAKPGAFKAKNSWGNESDYDGYVWISYEDMTIHNCGCIVEADQKISQSPTFIYNSAPFGFMAQYTPQNPTQTTFMNRYKSHESGEKLTQIGLFCATPCKATVEITSNKGTVKLITGQVLRYAGYHLLGSEPDSVDLPDANENFDISVTYESINGINVRVPIEKHSTTTPDRYSNINLNPGESFIDGKDVTKINSDLKTNFGHLPIIVVSQLESQKGKNIKSVYDNLKLPQSSGGIISNLPLGDPEVPIEWRVEPYESDTYLPNYSQNAMLYSILDSAGKVASQGIVNKSITDEISNLGITAIIGGTNTFNMKQLFVTKLGPSLPSYTFTVSEVTNINCVKLSGVFDSEGATVIVTCNNSQAQTVVSKGAWELPVFELYDVRKQGWDDSYKNSIVSVTITNGGTGSDQVILARGKSANITLTRPFDVDKTTLYVSIPAFVAGASIFVAYIAAICYCSTHGGGAAGAGATLSLASGVTYNAIPVNGDTSLFSSVDTSNTNIIVQPSGEAPATLKINGPLASSFHNVSDLELIVERSIPSTSKLNPQVLNYGVLCQSISKGGAISNCSVKGKISDPKNNFAGLFYSGEDVSVRNCYSAVEVDAAGSYAGIANTLTGHSQVTNTIVEGSVIASGPAAGIVLQLSDHSEISNCRVSGDFSGSSVAGVVPSMLGTASVKQCYTACRLNAGSGGTAFGVAGGISGEANSVLNCASICSSISGDKISRVAPIGASACIAYDGILSPTGKSFTDVNCSLLTNSELGIIDRFEGLGFDFTYFWNFDKERKFPTLKLRDSDYDYPFITLSGLVNEEFVVKEGEPIVLTGSCHAQTSAIKWTSITPSGGDQPNPTDPMTSTQNDFTYPLPLTLSVQGKYKLTLVSLLHDGQFTVVLPIVVNPK